MKTEKELNNDIVKITTTIEERFPELLKYLGEMPVKIPDSDSLKINNKNLKDYYDSLDALLKNYTLNHTIETK
jgi:hypothetical protein